MNKKEPQGIKPFASKAIIILMGLLYILGPVHLEVGKVLHSVAHSLEIPDTMFMAHPAPKATKTHKSVHHKKRSAQHDHKVLDLVKDILEGSEKGSDAPEKQRTPVKIDKHIKLRTSPPLDMEIIIADKKKTNWKLIKNKLQKGYKIGLKEPPQV